MRALRLALAFAFALVVPSASHAQAVGFAPMSTTGAPPGLSTTAGDLRYLKLDASNGPLTGVLGAIGINPTVNNSQNLGTSSLGWLTLFSNNITGTTGTLSLTGSSGGGMLFQTSVSAANAGTSLQWRSTVTRTAGNLLRYDNNGTVELQLTFDGTLSVQKNMKLGSGGGGAGGAGTLSADGGLILDGGGSNITAGGTNSFLPASNLSGNLGGTGQEWSNGFITTVRTAATKGLDLIASNATGDINISAQRNVNIGGTTTTPLLPSNDNTQNLGSVARRWAQQFVTTQINPSATIALGNPTDASAITASLTNVSAASATSWSVSEAGAIDGQRATVCNTGSAVVTLVPQAGVWVGSCLLTQNQCAGAVYQNSQWVQNWCGSDTRSFDNISSGGTQRIYRSPLATSGSSFTQVDNEAICEYVGEVSNPNGLAIQHVSYSIGVGGTGSQAAEVGVFSTPLAPNGTGQILTKIDAKAVTAALTASGVKTNATAMTGVAALGTHIWTCERIHMGTTQPVFGNGSVIQDMNMGQILHIANPGALTGVTIMGGALVPEVNGAEGPFLVGGLD